MNRILFLTIGWISVALGTLGIFLPLLPTTPFLLLALWCFAKSSPRFHAWLLSHPRFGPALRNWREKGAIPTRAKALAIAMIALSLGSIWLFAKVLAVQVAVSALLVGVSLFILTRPRQ